MSIKERNAVKTKDIYSQCVSFSLVLNIMGGDIFNKGMTRNAFIWVRISTEEKEIMVLDGMHKLVTELGRQGNKLNQLTVMVRQERISFVDFEQLRW